MSASTRSARTSLPAGRSQRPVILGVAASDSHAVANHLIAQSLRREGFTVVNLGTCTPVAEFADACARHPDALAVAIGSLNGQIHEDLRDLAAAQEAGRITCPVIVGGNLSVGSTKDPAAITRLYELGVDRVLASVSELVPVLDGLLAAAPAATVTRPLAAVASR
jgi:methylaspartate mutase sigma subunit